MSTLIKLILSTTIVAGLAVAYGDQVMAEEEDHRTVDTTQIQETKNKLEESVKHIETEYQSIDSLANQKQAELNTRREEEKKRQEQERIQRENEEKAKAEAEKVKEKTKPNTQNKSEVTTNKSSNVENNKPSGNAMQFQATAYTNHPSENGTYGGRVVTRTGFDITNTITYNGLRIIAVDPSIIPLNSRVRVSYGGTSFEAIALDTGSAIKGRIIDILMGDSGEMNSFGRRSVTVEILK